MADFHEKLGGGGIGRSLALLEPDQVLVRTQRANGGQELGILLF